MKYTRYLFYGRPIRPEQIGMLAIPSAFMGLALITGMMPGAMAMDAWRYFKLRRLLFKRRQKNLNYIKTVLRSLGHPETEEMINLLMAA